MSNKTVAALFAEDSGTTFTNEYFNSILNYLKQSLENAGYNLAFLNCSSKYSGRPSYLKQMEQNNYAGAVIIYAQYDEPEVVELIESDFPVVTIDCPLKNVSDVSSDNTKGFSELSNYICELGHRKIAYIMGDKNYITNSRKNTLLEVCKRYEIPSNHVYLFYSTYNNSLQSSFYTEELLSMDEPPTCIIYSSDFAAIGGYNILRARGYDVPNETSIAGFDGLRTASQFEPKLCTVHQDCEAIGNIAAEKIMEAIEYPDVATKESTIVPTTMIYGKTVADVSTDIFK